MEKNLSLTELIKEINIQNFKCFNNFSLKEINRINLIYGDNNAGKTAFLEALFVALSNENPINIFSTFRGFPISISVGGSYLKDSWNLLFYKFDERQQINIKLKFKDNTYLETKIYKPYYSKERIEREFTVNPNTLSLEWIFHDTNKSLYNKTFINFPTLELIQQFPPDVKNTSLPPFNIRTSGNLITPLKNFYYFTSRGKSSGETLVKFYGEIVSLGLKEIWTTTLRDIRTDIDQVDVINIGGTTSVGVKFKYDKNFYPIDSLGEGITKIVALLLLMITHKNGILIIDEIENGLYWKIQPLLWKVIEKWSVEYNVQLFITTHSYEFLKNIAENIQQPELLTGFTFKRKKDSIIAFPLVGEDFVDLINNNFEVR